LQRHLNRVNAARSTYTQRKRAPDPLTSFLLQIAATSAISIQTAILLRASLALSPHQAYRLWNFSQHNINRLDHTFAEPAAFLLFRGRGNMSDRVSFVLLGLRDGNKNESPRVVHTVVVLRLVFRDGSKATPSPAKRLPSQSPCYVMALEKTSKTDCRIPSWRCRGEAVSFATATPTGFGDVEGGVREFGSTLRFLEEWYHLSDWYVLRMI